MLRRRKKWKARIRAWWRKITAWPKRLWEVTVRFYLQLTGQLRRRAVIARLQPADIILASPRTRRLGPAALAYRLLLGARYVHSMLYIGDGKILHTTSKYGVIVGKVPRRIYRRDRYAIYRMPGLTDQDIEKIVREAMRCRGQKLDVAGLLTNVPGRLLGLKRALWIQEEGRVWCSRLIAQAYHRAGFPIVPPEELGRVTSEDLARSPRLVRVR